MKKKSATNGTYLCSPPGWRSLSFATKFSLCLLEVGCVVASRKINLWWQRAASCLGFQENEFVVVIHEEKSASAALSAASHHCPHHPSLLVSEKNSGNMAKTVGHTGMYLVLVNKANINNMEQLRHDVCKMKYLSKLSSSNSYSKFIRM